MKKPVEGHPPILVPLVCTEYSTTRGGVSCAPAVGAPLAGSQLAAETVLRREFVAWLDQLAPWTVKADLTFRWCASLPSAQRCVEKFFGRVIPDLAWFYALERNPARDGNHVHAIVAAPPSLYRKAVWQMWFESYGRAYIDLIRSKRDVESYASKYAVKKIYTGCGWWNFHVPDQARYDLGGGARRVSG